MRLLPSIFIFCGLFIVSVGTLFAEEAPPQGSEPSDVQALAPPLPAQFLGVAVELSSISDQPGTFELSPRVAISERHLPHWPGILGADIILAPQTGAASWAQGLIGFGIRAAYPHPYGGLKSRGTVYKDALTLGDAPRGIPDPLQAYEVVEGGELKGWAVDVRALGLVAGPRFVYEPGLEDEGAASVGAYVGVEGIYQQSPGWVINPKEIGTALKPESTFVGDVGVLWHRQKLWLELGMGMTGGPGIVGFGRRRVYGRLTARISEDAIEFSMGIGGARQRNPGMGVLPARDE